MESQMKTTIFGSCRSLRMQGICQQCVDQNVLGTFRLKWNRCLLGTDWTKSPESPSDFLSWRAMADAKTTPLTLTKASPEEAAPGDFPDIPDIEMVDSTREWPVENDAWQYLHDMRMSKTQQRQRSKQRTKSSCHPWLHATRWMTSSRSPWRTSTRPSLACRWLLMRWRLVHQRLRSLRPRPLVPPREQVP